MDADSKYKEIASEIAPARPRSVASLRDHRFTPDLFLLFGSSVEPIIGYKSRTM